MFLLNVSKLDPSLQTGMLHLMPVSSIIQINHVNAAFSSNTEFYCDTECFRGMPQSDTFSLTYLLTYLMSPKLLAPARFYTLKSADVSYNHHSNDATITWIRVQ